MESALFIIGSPFQGLCMLEAIDYFHITDFDVLIPQKSTGSNTTQLKALLNDEGVFYTTYSINHAIKDLIPYFLHKHKHYSNIFIGNYYSPIDEAMAAFYGKRNYNLYFLDDGTQALSLFSEHPRYRYSAKKWEAIFNLYYRIGKLKGNRNRYFFTIYDVKSKDFIIVKNNFSRLKKDISSEKRGVYIIGTNSSILNFRDITYLSLLDSLVEWLRKNYANGKIYYCPHRRDLNIDEIRQWCNNNGVEWFNTRVAVEYDFVTLGYNPICVCGFTSNALYTLKSIYSSSDIYTVYYKLSSESADKETAIIREQMKKSGIKELRLDSTILSE